MTLRYRHATADDLPVIVKIYNSIIPGRMVTADTEPVSVENRLAWFNAHDEASRPLWIVMEENDIIGWVSFQSFYGRPAYKATAELSIYLEENSRGKGYGVKILQYAMDSCEQLHIKTLLGFIFAHNIPSLKLFRKTGFTDWGHFPGVAVLDGIERDLIIVGKRINA
ncbi:MAG TPA: GNAT family N-acetyltransferase [Flavitalea sp.]|nr:GNAT family N-acetyltransferase [Flavitalea sp.]